LGNYDLVVSPQSFNDINLRLVSIVTAELGGVFDCEDLIVLLDSVVGMSTAMDANSSDMGTLSRTAALNKSVATLRLARSLACSGNLPTPAAGPAGLTGSSLAEDAKERIQSLQAIICIRRQPH
jgi:hypothetical protein